MAIEAAHVLVSGIVQGVGYRAWTERNARDLGLMGWVRNLDDGRVEILVEGEKKHVDELIDRCYDGPRHAEVRNIEVHPAKAAGATSFAVLRTATEPMTTPSSS
jgi:acylphosphatase